MRHKRYLLAMVLGGLLGIAVALGLLQFYGPVNPELGRLLASMIAGYSLMSIVLALLGALVGGRCGKSCNHPAGW